VSILQEGNKNHRQPAFFGDHFLRQFQPLSLQADHFAQDAAVFRNLRHISYKQESAQNDIYYSLILELQNFGEERKNGRVLEIAAD
jgi:hypothetical protein